MVGEGFDAVIEMTGVMSTIDEGLGVLRRKGIFVATGIHPDKASIDITRMVRQPAAEKLPLSTARMNTWSSENQS